MKIYVAGPWKHRDSAALAAKRVRRAGHDVTSRWHDGVSEDDETLMTARQEALTDVFDVNRSEGMIVLNIERSEGKAVEQGLAMAKGITIVVVGERTNIFQSLDEHFTLVNSLDEALRVLEPYLPSV